MRPPVHPSSSLFSTLKVVYGPWLLEAVLPSYTRMLLLRTVLLTSLQTMENTLVLPLRDKLMNMPRPSVSLIRSLILIFVYIIFFPVDLITRGQPNPDGKILIIGGGIANFTNVSLTTVFLLDECLLTLHRLPPHSRVSSALYVRSLLSSTSTTSRSGSVVQAPTTRKVSRTSRA